MKLLNNSVMAKVLKSRVWFSWSAPRRSGGSRDIDVPEDVREGHFAVVAGKGEERKRFIVKLECLSDPDFLRLLEEAREEYGFGQKGALALPCRPEQLQMIIENPRPTANAATATPT